MLGKLMKYEWKNIWKAGTLMLLGMLVVTVIGCVVLRMPGGLVTEIADGNMRHRAGLYSLPLWQH